MLSNGNILDQAGEPGRKVFSEHESKEILAREGIPVTRSYLAGSAGEAAELALKIGYPVALKIASRKVTHKSDVGGVKLNLQNGEEVQQAFTSLFETAQKYDPAAKISVQPMAPPGLELIVGLQRDRYFGPVVMFGLGGVWTEIYSDARFALVPLTRSDAGRIINNLQGRRLLDGYRNLPPVNKDALVNLLMQVSDLAGRRPEIVALDINPVLAYPDGIIVVDCRLVIAD